MGKITVLLIDDHKLMRDGVRSLIEGRSGLQVIGEAADGRSAVALVGELRPDVAVMDVAMPDLNGVEATRQIIAQCPNTRVVALSMHAGRRFVREMFAAGASAYVHKSSAFEELVNAIHTVANGGTHTSPKITEVILQDYVGQLSRPTIGAVPRLTPRECEVVQLLAEGHSSKALANRLHISVNTVETHRQRVMAKLDLHSIAALTKFAIREGLTSTDG